MVFEDVKTSFVDPREPELKPPTGYQPLKLDDSFFDDLIPAETDPEKILEDLELTPCFTPDPDSDDATGYGSKTKTQKPTRASAEAYKDTQRKLHEYRKRRIKDALKKSKEAKTETEKETAQEEVKEAVRNIVSEPKFLRYKRNREGKEDLILTPLSRMSTGTAYRGGEIEFTYAIDKLMGDFGSSTDEAKKQIFALYLRNQALGDTTPATTALKSYLASEHPKETINTRIFPNTDTIFTEAETLKNELKNLFVAYKKDYYAGLAIPDVDGHEAARRAFEKMVENMGETIDCHTKFALLLQGNETEKLVAQVILTEAWTNASAEYRVELDEEIKKLSPEQLRKIGQARQEILEKDLQQGREYLQKMVLEEQNLMSLVFMATFCPPLFFFTCIPTFISFSFAAYDQIRLGMLKPREEQFYTKLDERIDVMSAINVTDALVTSFIDLNSREHGNLYLNAVNSMIHPAAAQDTGKTPPSLLDLKEQLHRQLTTVEEVVDKNGNSKTVGLEMRNYYEKLMEMGSDESNIFVANLMKVHKEIQDQKDLLCKGIEEQEKKLEDILNTKPDVTDWLKEKAEAAGADIKADSMSETVQKLMRHNNWFIDAYMPHSIEELRGQTINNSADYSNNAMRGVFTGASSKILDNYYKDILNQNPEEGLTNTQHSLDMKSRLMMAFGQYHDAEAGSEKLGLGYIKSAFMSDYLKNAVTEIMDNQINQIKTDETWPTPSDENKNAKIISKEEAAAFMSTKKDEIVRQIENNNIWDKMAQKAGYKEDSEIPLLMQQFSIAMAISESYEAQVKSVERTLGNDNSFGDVQLEAYRQEALKEAVELRDKIKDIDPEAFEKYKTAIDEIKKDAGRTVVNPSNLNNNWKAVSMAGSQSLVETLKTPEDNVKKDNEDPVRQQRKERGARMAKSYALLDPEKYQDPDKETGSISKAEEQARFISQSVDNIIAVAKQETALSLKNYIEKEADLKFEPEVKAQADTALKEVVKKTSGTDIKIGTDPRTLSILLGASESQLGTQSMANQLLNVGHSFNTAYNGNAFGYPEYMGH